MPTYLLLFGLTMTEAAGTSLPVIDVLTVPTLAAHWALGHIDWTVAGARTFGWFLITCGGLFVIYRLAR